MLQIYNLPGHLLEKGQWCLQQKSPGEAGVCFLPWNIKAQQLKAARPNLVKSEMY